MDVKKKYGLTFFEYKGEGNDKAYLVAQEFVEELFFLMSKLSTRFCNDKYDFCDLPYTYTESRIDSVLLPALSKLCNSLVLTELPVERKLKGELSAGRIDYWCIYKDYSFIIELKQGFDDFETDNTRQKAFLENWAVMIEQLDSVKSEAKGYEEKTKGIIRLGLHIITSYSKKSPTSEVVSSFDAARIEDIAARFLRDSKKKTPSRKPDTILCWKIPQRIVKEGGITYPGLWCVSKIYPPIIHGGAK